MLINRAKNLFKTNCTGINQLYNHKIKNMKKKNPGADSHQTKNKKNMPQKGNSTPENLSPKEEMPLNHENEHKKTTFSQSPQKAI